MEHVVFSAAVDGVGEEFRRVSSLEEAVRVVEHLRNDLGIEEASVFALTHIPLAFRTYYRVEVPGVESSPLALVSESESESEPEPEIAVLAPPESDEALPVPAIESFESFESFESAGLAEPAELAELAEPAQLPAMFAPSLEPRGSEQAGPVEGESEHSLGYFTR